MTMNAAPTLVVLGVGDAAADLAWRTCGLLPRQEAVALFAPLRWSSAATAAAHALRPLRPRLMVILGSAGPEAHGFAAALTAVNAADPCLADAAGARWPGGRISPGAPPRRRMTLKGLARALAEAGAPVRLVRDVGLGIVNRCAFTMLGVADGVMVGALTAGPQAQADLLAHALARLVAETADAGPFAAPAEG